MKINYIKYKICKRTNGEQKADYINLNPINGYPMSSFNHFNKLFIKIKCKIFFYFSIINVFPNYTFYTLFQFHQSLTMIE